MVPPLQRVANDYSVPVYSSGGFDSLTAKHAIAKQISDAGNTVEVLHIGDHGPSGVHMFGSLDEDVRAFVNHYSGGSVSFNRLAVTPKQVEQYRLPTAPQKATDRRSFDSETTTQCEALDPLDLAAIVRHGIESRQDSGIRQVVIGREAEARQALWHRLQLTG